MTSKLTFTGHIKPVIVVITVSLAKKVLPKAVLFYDKENVQIMEK